jgi:hypothetical protein
MQGRHYHFNGNTEEIINSILSLLLGKEYYREVSLYSSFLSESHTARYRKRLKIILDLMQKENLILIRENPEDVNHTPAKAIENNCNYTETLPTGTAIVYLRQHGKEILSNGGYKRILQKKNSKSLPL